MKRNNSNPVVRCLINDLLYSLHSSKWLSRPLVHKNYKNWIEYFKNDFLQTLKTNQISTETSGDVTIIGKD